LSAFFVLGAMGCSVEVAAPRCALSGLICLKLYIHTANFHYLTLLLHTLAKITLT
jgi:hypothetical protein